MGVHSGSTHFVFFSFAMIGRNIRQICKFYYSAAVSKKSISDLLCVIVLYNLPQTQEKEMDELNPFIEHYLKYIVSIIWQRYILTLHLSHTNCWKAFNLSGSCCQFCSYMLCNFYLIESYQTSLKLSPF